MTTTDRVVPPLVAVEPDTLGAGLDVCPPEPGHPSIELADFRSNSPASDRRGVR